jgi:hypothetical protein
VGCRRGGATATERLGADVEEPGTRNQKRLRYLAAGFAVLSVALALSACGSPALNAERTEKSLPSQAAVSLSSSAVETDKGTIIEGQAGNDDWCPVTRPNGMTPPTERPSAGHYGNGKLWTVLWSGTVRFEAGGPGSIEPDGALSMKWPWWHDPGEPLRIEGRRLDGEEGPLRSYIPGGYLGSTFQATALIFPTPGCWEVTGRAGDASLSFVTLVSQTP